MFRAQSSPSAIPGPPRAPGLQSRLRLRMGEQESVLRAICAGRQLLPGERACRAASAARGPRARDPERGEGPGAAGSVHHGAHQSGEQQPRRYARQFAQGRAAAERGGLRDQGRRARRQQDREAAHGRVPARVAAVRAHRAALYRAISSGSASRRRSAWWTARNIRGGSTASTTTSSSAISPSRIRPATSSATSGAPRPPAAKAAATSSASRTRQSTSWSTT